MPIDLSLNHFICTGKQFRRHSEAERFCRLEIDHQFNFGALLDGKVSRLGALEKFSDIRPYLPIQLQGGSPVTHQAASRRKFPEWINRRYRMAGCEPD